MKGKRLDYVLRVLILEAFLVGLIPKEKAQKLGRLLKLRGFGK